ncbi:MAG: hypothetical protein QW341_01485 [Candidatus Bathyarchaeia archaeon]
MSARKYGYASCSIISEFIAIYENREAILQQLFARANKPIGRKEALRVLRELEKKICIKLQDGVVPDVPHVPGFGGQTPYERTY